MNVPAKLGNESRVIKWERCFISNKDGYVKIELNEEGKRLSATVAREGVIRRCWEDERDQTNI